MRSMGWPVASASIWLRCSRIQRVSSATIWMSVCWPWTPELGWWISTMELGSARRLPLAPQARMAAPMEAAMPTQMVETSGLMKFIVSMMPRPA